MQALAENGAQVDIVDIDAEAGERAAREVVESGGTGLELEL